MEAIVTFCDGYTLFILPCEAAHMVPSFSIIKAPTLKSIYPFLSGRRNCGCY